MSALYLKNHKLNSPAFIFKYFILYLILELICHSLFANHQYSTSSDYLLHDENQMIIKGVVFVPFYPGYLPWNIPQTITQKTEFKNYLNQNFELIQAMGANTIRLWDGPDELYQTLENYNLAILQTIWFPVDAPDLQAETFKNQCRQIILKKLNQVYLQSHQQPNLLGFLIGNEISRKSIENTNKLHPQLNSYQGQYFKTTHPVTASECFLAEMADFLRSEEIKRYHQSTLISYANEIRTYDLIDTPYLDFRCFNVYSYTLPDFVSYKEGSSTQTFYQGWIEYLKNKYPNIPLLITETGLSVSPSVINIGPPDYGYGGNSIDEQASGILSFWNDVLTAKPPLAGMIIHEFHDAWWKFSIQDSLTRDPEDIEEWFGIAELFWEKPNFYIKPKPAYQKLKQVWKDL